MLFAGASFAGEGSDEERPFGNTVTRLDTGETMHLERGPHLCPQDRRKTENGTWSVNDQNQVCTSTGSPGPDGKLMPPACYTPPGDHKVGETWDGHRNGWAPSSR